LKTIDIIIIVNFIKWEENVIIIKSGKKWKNSIWYKTEIVQANRHTGKTVLRRGDQLAQSLRSMWLIHIFLSSYYNLIRNKVFLLFNEWMSGFISCIIINCLKTLKSEMLNIPSYIEDNNYRYRMPRMQLKI
jgi:hypothetical protein